MSEKQITSWADRPQVQFGDMGEAIVLNYAKKQGWHDILQKGDNPSAVDFIFADENNNIVEIVEVKTRKKVAEPFKGVPAYAISNAQFEQNYKPILDEWLGVPFILYIVDAKQGKIIKNCFDYLEEADCDHNTDFDINGNTCVFPVVKADSFGGKEVNLRYYLPSSLRGNSFSFSGTSKHEKLQALAAKVTVDTIDDSPLHEPGKTFISAEDIIDFVKSLESNNGKLQFGGWSLRFGSGANNYLGYYFIEDDAFVTLSDLKDIGVSLWTIPKSCYRNFDFCKDTLIPCAELDSIFLQQITGEQWIRWKSIERDNFNGICKARKFFKKQFNLNMPDDTAKFYVMLQSLDLQQKPLWWLYSVYTNLYAFRLTLEGKVFRNIAIKSLQKIHDERQQFQHKDAETVVLKNPSKLIGTIKTPQEISLDIISSAGRSFINGNQLGNACGYNKTGALSSSYFTNAIAAVSKFYKVRRPGKSKPTLHIPIEDVAKVLSQFYFNAPNREHSELTEKMLSFWNAQYKGLSA